MNPARWNGEGLEIDIASRSMTGAGVDESERNMYEEVSERNDSGVRAESELCMSGS